MSEKARHNNRANTLCTAVFVSCEAILVVRELWLEAEAGGDVVHLAILRVLKVTLLKLYAH